MTTTWFGPEDSVLLGPVEVSYDDGVPFSAVVHLNVLQTSYQQVTIAFCIDDDGVGRLKGFVKPHQPSIPHISVVPIACGQLEAISDVARVEDPAVTLERYFKNGRGLKRV